MRNIVLTAVLLATAAAGSAQSVKAGIEAWQRADYAAAVGIWRPLAEAGDADAAFNLGQAYRLGRGFPINLAAAQTWFERAADKGHLDAQTTLGLMLFNSGNRVGGIRWLKTAAEQGEPRALLIYGTALFNGDGVVRDPVRAYAYVSRAAAQGLAPAKTTLADMDKLIPVDQRQKGVALALEAAKASAPKQAPARKAAPKKAAATASAPRPTATASMSPSGPGWRLQLGAFSTRAAAEALYRKLFASGVIVATQASYVPAGKFTRLQVGWYKTKADAAAACRGMASRGQPCFPVASR